jgi:enediyne biosynthesis protein E7
MEAQCILAMIAQRYHLALPPGHRVTPDAVLALGPRGGLPMTVQALPA